MTELILVPGLWLDGSSWAQVVPPLEQAGHRVHAVTPPGMESVDADRGGVGRREIVDAIDAIVELVDAADGQVVLVGHSAGAGLAYAALDARVDRVAHVVYVGGFPTGPGRPVAGGFATTGGDLPMPPLTEFGEEDLADLDEAGRAAFQARAIPSPARLATDLQELTDDRRYGVPATVVCTEFTAADLREWIATGEPAVQELTKLHSVTYIDLPTGHWPQLTRPQALAETILTAL